MSQSLPVVVDWYSKRRIEQIKKIWKGKFEARIELPNAYLDFASLILFFREEAARLRFREWQQKIFDELRATDARLRMQVRTGTEFFPDSLIPERKYLNNQKRL